jgi:hypothetical protein
MAVELPELRLVWSGVHTEVCVHCGRDWLMSPDIPSPGAYTTASIDAGLPPDPVCDFCLEQHAPQRFADLLAERRRFYSS